MRRRWATDLFVLETEQEDLLHQRELGLLAPLGALADVAWVKGDLVAVLAALVARLGGAVAGVGCAGSIGGAVAAVAVAGAFIAGASSRAPAPRQARRRGRGHVCAARRTCGSEVVDGIAGSRAGGSLTVSQSKQRRRRVGDSGIGNGMLLEGAGQWWCRVGSVRGCKVERSRFGRFAGSGQSEQSQGPGRPGLTGLGLSCVAKGLALLQIVQWVQRAIYNLGL